MRRAVLGTGGNTIAGALGGVAGGSLLTSLIPMLHGRGGRRRYWRYRGPGRRRRHIRRDRNGDRRHDHEQHAQGLIAPAVPELIATLARRSQAG
jgi:hypothetical protein